MAGPVDMAIWRDESEAYRNKRKQQDFPRGSMRNGLIDGTKCQSLESKGNLSRLLCIAYTTSGSAVLKRCLKLFWKQFIAFLKLYLCMEEWSHDANDKNEVI